MVFLWQSFLAHIAPFLVAIIILSFLYFNMELDRDKRIVTCFVTPLLLMLACLVPVKRTECWHVPDDSLKNEKHAVVIWKGHSFSTDNKEVVTAISKVPRLMLKETVARTAVNLLIPSTRKYEVVLDVRRNWIKLTRDNPQLYDYEDLEIVWITKKDFFRR